MLPIRSLIIPLALVSFAALLNCPNDLPSTTEGEAIQQYLRVKYDDFEPSLVGHSSIYDLAFISSSSKIVPVQSSVISHFLPDTHFYRTTLATAEVEYPNVETLISSVRTMHGWDIRTCLSPTYRQVSRKFLAQFQAIRTTDPREQKAIASGIAELLASITYQGRVGQAELSEGVYSVDLWNGDMLYRVVNVQFLQNGSLVGVMLWNPKRATNDS